LEKEKEKEMTELKQLTGKHKKAANT